MSAFRGLVIVTCFLLVVIGVVITVATWTVNGWAVLAAVAVGVLFVVGRDREGV